MKQRGQFAVGQRPDGGIIGILQGFQASREVAGKHLRAEDVAVARIRAERLLHEVVRVARGIQFLKPGLAQDIGGEGSRLGDAAARCRRALHDGLDAEGRIQKVDARHGCPPLPVKKTEVAESGFGDGIHDAAEELDGPFDARRRRLPFGETGEKDNIAPCAPPPDSGMGSACR